MLINKEFFAFWYRWYGIFLYKVFLLKKGKKRVKNEIYREYRNLSIPLYHFIERSIYDKA